MSNVIFDGSKEESVEPASSSVEVLQEFKQFFNDLEFKVLVGLKNYEVNNDRWPTFRELAGFMGENPDNVQPRLSELRHGHAVVACGKRACSESGHNRSVTVFKPADHVLERLEKQ